MCYVLVNVCVMLWLHDLTKAVSRVKFCAGKMYLKPQYLRLLSVLRQFVLLVLIYCLMYFLLLVGVLCLSLFWHALLCVLSSFAIILKRKRERAGCFGFIVLMISCNRICAVAHSALGWSTVCD